MFNLLRFTHAQIEYLGLLINEEYRREKHVLLRIKSAEDGMYHTGGFALIVLK